MLTLHCLLCSNLYCKWAAAESKPPWVGRWGLLKKWRISWTWAWLSLAKEYSMKVHLLYGLRYRYGSQSTGVIKLIFGSICDWLLYHSRQTSNVFHHVFSLKVGIYATLRGGKVWAQAGGRHPAAVDLQGLWHSHLQGG